MCRKREELSSFLKKKTDFTQTLWDPVGIDRWEESSTWVSEVLVLF